MGIDGLGQVLERFRVQATTFQAGPLCGVTRYDESRGVGFVHILREGRMVLSYVDAAGMPCQQALEEPTLLFFPRPFTHGFMQASEAGSELFCAKLRFEGGAAHPLARSLPPVLVVPLASLPVLGHTLALLFDEQSRIGLGQRVLADRLFEVLLIQLLRWLETGPEAGRLPAGLLAGLAHPKLSVALAAMHDRPAQAWTLEQLAELAAMSRSSFAASFHRVLGETPADYLARWRIALAQQALKRGEALKRVALDTGYGSSSALSRAFSARVGLAPRAWLQAQRDQVAT